MNHAHVASLPPPCSLQVRSVCVILDSFHFITPRQWEIDQRAAEAAAGVVAFGSAAPLSVSAVYAATVTTQPAPAEGGSGARLDASSSDDEDEEEEAAAAAAAAVASGRRGGKAAFIPDPAILAADIRMVLQGRVLPCLHSHLVEDEEVRGVGPGEDVGWRTKSSVMGGGGS